MSTSCVCVCVWIFCRAVHRFEFVLYNTRIFGAHIYLAKRRRCDAGQQSNTMPQPFQVFSLIVLVCTMALEMYIVYKVYRI